MFYNIFIYIILICDSGYNIDYDTIAIKYDSDYD